MHTQNYYYKTSILNYLSHGDAFFFIDEKHFQQFVNAILYTVKLWIIVGNRVTERLFVRVHRWTKRYQLRQEMKPTKTPWWGWGMGWFICKYLCVCVERMSMSKALLRLLLWNTNKFNKYKNVIETFQSKKNKVNNIPFFKRTMSESWATFPFSLNVGWSLGKFWMYR